MRLTQSKEQRVGLVVFLGFITLVAASTMVQGAPTAAPERGSFVLSLDSAAWTTPYEGPLGFPKGVQTSSLGVDPVTSGETYYARFPAGSHFEMHWHSYAEYATVLRGKVTLTLGTETHHLADSDYVVIPAKMNHEWQVDSSGEMILLVRRDGPADFNLS